MRDSKILKRATEGIDEVDQNRLKMNRYSELSPGWKTVYIIKNVKFDNKVAEIRATSFIHACNLIGWRPRQVELISSFPAGD